jgi:hypothetical protein
MLKENLHISITNLCGVLFVIFYSFLEFSMFATNFSVSDELS